MSVLHVYIDGAERFEVWIDCEGGADQDGICVGNGSCEEEALQDAVNDLEKTLAEAKRHLSLCSKPAKITR